MRNPDRIEPMLARLGELWKAKVPDWRFGQMMYNYIAVIGDPFYLEDEDFMAGLEAYMKNEDPNKAIRDSISERLKRGYK